MGCHLVNVRYQIHDGKKRRKKFFIQNKSMQQFIEMEFKWKTVIEGKKSEDIWVIIVF